MKKNYASFGTILSLYVLSSFFTCQHVQAFSLRDSLAVKAASNQFVATSTPTAKMLRHVVLFKFKDTASPAKIKEVEDAFLALPSKINQIKSLEWGLNNSPENLNQGFTHCFFVTFSSEADRAVYLPHPDHKAFGKILGPHLDKVLVVDYWTGK